MKNYFSTSRLSKIALLLIAVFPAPYSVFAQNDFVSARQVQPKETLSGKSALLKLSIEELLQIEVTTVSRKAESLKNAAAAVTVITNEDIHRTGVTSIPEALRFVPGIFVGQRNSNSWAVSSRGFSSTNSEKMLVLSDSRSIYTPLFSGVFWDVQNYVMDDIDRIEVIRGPGGSTWGANAVNGVVNIITKDAKDTQGLYAKAGGGSEEHLLSAVRYGGKVGEDIHYRVFARYFDRDDTFNPSSESSDDWRIGHFGFRSDWEATNRDSITIQGDGYLGEIGQFAPAVNIIGRPGPEGDLEVDVNGGNLLGRWTRDLGNNSSLVVRAYYDRTRRDDPSFDDTLNTADLDIQHSFDLTPRQHMIWGINYRLTDNTSESGEIFELRPESSEDQLISTFIQNQIDILDTLQLTLGTKVEHNDFSGFEVQPTIRAAWQAMPEHTFWSAVSRAVRVPTRIERDVNIAAADPASNPLPVLMGNDDFDSEELIAYEAGYRWQAHENLSLDLALFYDDYDELSSLELSDPFLADNGQTIVPIFNQNLTSGHGQGVETTIAYSPLDVWRLTAIYSYLDLSLHSDGMDLNRGTFHEGSTPQHQFGIRSYLNLPAGFQFDAQLRSLSEIRSNPEIPEGGGISGYTELDLRLGWQATEEIEFSVIGRNLLDRRHVETGTPAARGEIQRSVFGQMVYRFK